ncbi:class Ib ribonucleoside-diphosphate reductase assembly flavoprotein NrdI [Williamsia sterculiae]|uniref:Protein NrdI n=1 Tax=Williamsia sterculiae TaxID=1344003 RepID=A0A1N7FQQ2_9NOCA|nr:class Ib ribonucleoside-diphosphate reductase assembly flavoprotein NrdI [Williamsia sterculiae]SIS02617.1 protein involved in ribonucleotide reduction [Williamsia sterculiae]
MTSSVVEPSRRSAAQPTLVYFSSVSENTHRFVAKLGLPAVRIPVTGDARALTVDGPFVLITPTYGGGSRRPGAAGSVPRQVVTFLNNPDNRAMMRAVIAAGNTNFGEDYCLAGDIISAKCQVPYLYRFELMGTVDDVERVRIGLDQFWTAQEQTQCRQPQPQ